MSLSQYGIDADYPLLYEKAIQYDFANRLGGSMDPLMAEIDAALRELWDGRRTRDRYREALEQIAADITAYMTGDFDRYIAEAMRRRDLARAALATPDTPPDA